MPDPWGFSWEETPGLYSHFLFVMRGWLLCYSRIEFSSSWLLLWNFNIYMTKWYVYLLIISVFVCVCVCVFVFVHVMMWREFSMFPIIASTNFNNLPITFGILYMYIQIKDMYIWFWNIQVSRICEKSWQLYFLFKTP